MVIYRLEHRSSGLGPFRHRSARQKHPSQDALKYLNIEDKSFMPDLQVAYVIRALEQYPGRVVFGWDRMDKVNQMVRDWEAIEKLGFRVRTHTAVPLYRMPCGQIIFDRSK